MAMGYGNDSYKKQP